MKATVGNESNKIKETALSVINTEIEQVTKLLDFIDQDFVGAVNAICNCSGKLIVSGMGKSGLIGKKIAATFASYGTQSFFLHPAEAYHGDLGMIDSEDVILLLSNSGETDEILKIVPFLQDQKNIIIGMTGNINSSLAENSDFHINITVAEEACPLDLAPTSSTTATLIMGDALAVSTMVKNNVKPEHFARFHPGGNLGRKLLSKVEQEMVSGNNLPKVYPQTSAIDTIHSISDGRLGAAVVVDNNQNLKGIITDGDIRRATLKNNEKVLSLNASDIMTKEPRVIQPNMRVFEAEKIMDSMRIHQLIVVNSENKVVGLMPYRSQMKNKSNR